MNGDSTGAGAAIAPGANDDTSVTSVTRVTPHFKMVFICIMTLTVLTLAASLYIGIFVERPTEVCKSAMDNCSKIANLGFGTILGLLGGKAAQ